MPEYCTVNEPDVEVEEEIKGEQLFTWKNLIFGLLAGGSDYVDNINRAIDEAYAER